MTSYWDAAAIVPLLIPEQTSDQMFRRLRSETALVTWWGTPVECESALARRSREGLNPQLIATARVRLTLLRATWTEIQVADEVRNLAMRVLWDHALRAADALQLAAALHAADGTPGRLGFVSLDGRLRTAAAREGFPVFGGAPGDP